MTKTSPSTWSLLSSLDIVECTSALLFKKYSDAFDYVSSHSHLDRGCLSVTPFRMVPVSGLATVTGKSLRDPLGPSSKLGRRALIRDPVPIYFNSSPAGRESRNCLSSDRPYLFTKKEIGSSRIDHRRLVYAVVLDTDTSNRYPR